MTCCCCTTRLVPGLLLGVAALLAIGLYAGPQGTSIPTVSQPATMTDAEFAKLLAAVRPCVGEDDFDKIPWLVSIWDAREKAAKEGKPILLWEMDGHPLGCG